MVPINNSQATFRWVSLTSLVVALSNAKMTTLYSNAMARQLVWALLRRRQGRVNLYKYL